MCYSPTTGSYGWTSAGIVFGRDEYNLRLCRVPTTPIKRGVSRSHVLLSDYWFM